MSDTEIGALREKLASLPVEPLSVRFTLSMRF